MSRTPCGRTGRVESFFFFYRSCSFEKENITGLVVSIEMIQLQWTTKWKWWCLYSQGLDQMSLEGVEGTKEKRAKIVTYVVNNLRRWQPPRRNVYILFSRRIISATTFTSTSSSSASCWIWWTCLVRCGWWTSSSTASSQLMASRWGSLGDVSQTVWNMYFNNSRLPLKVVRLAGQNIEERADPMARVFPKMTKCTFHKWGQIFMKQNPPCPLYMLYDLRYGPSGTIVNHDGLCILPINIINEKIYVFLWCALAALCLKAPNILPPGSGSSC